MPRICIKSRDELIVIDTARLAYVLADGNYCKLVYIEGMQSMLSLGMSKVAEILSKSERQPERPVFLRLGRSLIVNQRFLLSISVPKQRIVLSDFGKNSHAISVPKPLLKQYKEKFDTLQQVEAGDGDSM